MEENQQGEQQEMEQAIQPDGFSVEAPKPAKAPKAKAEKEAER